LGKAYTYLRFAMAVTVECDGVQLPMNLSDSMTKLYKAYGLPPTQLIGLVAYGRGREQVRESRWGDTTLSDLGYQAGDSIFIVEALGGGTKTYQLRMCGSKAYFVGGKPKYIGPEVRACTKCTHLIANREKCCHMKCPKPGCGRTF